MYVLCRTGEYTLNMSAGSDGDLLLTSPNRDKDVQSENSNTDVSHTTTTSTNPSSSHDPSTTPSSNGIETADPSSPPSGSSPKDERRLLNSNDNCSKNTDSNASTSSSGAGNDVKVNSKATIPDGEIGNEEELQDNYR